jgi:hypothetical protein
MNETLSYVEIMLALAVAFGFPAVHQFIWLKNRDGSRCVYEKLLRIFYWPLALSGLISLVMPQGLLAGYVSIGWLVFCFGLAGYGVRRFIHHGISRPEEIVIDISLFNIGVGGVWFVASRFGLPFIGFTDPIVSLTAVHFHYFSWLLVLGMGLICRVLVQRGDPLRFWIIGLSLFITICIYSVAMGFSGVKIAKILGVAGVTGALIIYSLFLIFRIHAMTQKKSLYLFAYLGSFAFIFSMVLAFSFEFQIVSLSIKDMVMTHGLINALLVVPCFLIVGIFLNPYGRDSLIPIYGKRLVGRLFPSKDCFNGLADKETKTELPRGIVQDFKKFAREDFDLSKVDERIIHYYENTGEYNIRIITYRHGILGFLWEHTIRRFSAWIGQLNLPLQYSDVEVKLFPIDPKTDDRPSIRGWKGKIKQTGEILYVAACSTHTQGGDTYMNVAFPLPISNLTNILRVQHGMENPSGIQMSTQADPSSPREQGVYFVIFGFAIRIPMDEKVNVWWEDELNAKYEMWALGIKFLTLRYTMNRLTN